jgi:hypothetical protein
MKAKEKAVREAAANLHTAISEASAAGYHVNWPLRHEDLAAIEISEGASVETDEPAPVTEEPVVVEHHRSRAK